MWTLPWQAQWQFPLHIITAQAVAVGCVWCSWWQFSIFQCRIASLWIIWLCEYRDMDRIDIGSEMRYQYWYRYRKICNDMQPYLAEWRLYASVNWVSIGSGNDLSSVWSQAITWTNTDLLPIGHLGTNFNEIWIEILTFSFKKIRLKIIVCKMAAILSWPQCVNLKTSRVNSSLIPVYVLSLWLPAMPHLCSCCQ